MKYGHTMVITVEWTGFGEPEHMICVFVHSSNTKEIREFIDKVRDEFCKILSERGRTFLKGCSNKLNFPNQSYFTLKALWRCYVLDLSKNPKDYAEAVFDDYVRFKEKYVPRGMDTVVASVYMPIPFPDDYQKVLDVITATCCPDVEHIDVLWAYVDDWEKTRTRNVVHSDVDYGFWWADVGEDFVVLKHRYYTRRNVVVTDKVLCEYSKSYMTGIPEDRVYYSGRVQRVSLCEYF